MSDIIKRTTIENQADGFPAPPGVEKNFVNPDNNAWATIPAGWTLIAIAIVLVALRFAAKFQDKKRIFRWDDRMYHSSYSCSSNILIFARPGFVGGGKYSLAPLTIKLLIVVSSVRSLDSSASSW